MVSCKASTESLLLLARRTVDIHTRSPYNGGRRLALEVYSYLARLCPNVCKGPD